MLKIIILFTSINMIFWTLVRTERVYSLVSDLQPLLKTQRSVINNLEKIIERKKRTLSYVERKLAQYQLENQKSNEYLKHEVEPPINSDIIRLIITKRLALLALDQIFLNHSVKENPELNRTSSLKYPIHEDMDEAVRMLSRLQRFYTLNVTELANGILNIVNSKGEVYTELFLPMTTSDCYMIGKTLLKTTKKINYGQGLLWLLEALRLYDEESHVYGLEKADIFRYISRDNVLDENKSYKGIEKLEEPKHNRYKALIDFEIGRRQYLQQQQAKKTRKSKPVNPVEEMKNCLKGLDRKTYRMLCRGEVYIAPEISKRLKCWYHVGRHPFTRLAPFRAEQLYTRPDVTLVHNVVADTEINTLETYATPLLQPLVAFSGPKPLTSMVYNIGKGTGVNASVAKAILRRISDFTSFAASQLLVSNHGVGGHYVGHVDGLDRPDREEIKRHFNLTEADKEKIEYLFDGIKTNNVITSVIIYLSDVEAGGATVFPVLGLSQSPVRGAALFWSNLLPSGGRDFATCHGICPVLRGSRWVAASFIESESQVLNEPCSKKYTSRRIKDIPIPVLKNNIDRNQI